MTAVAATQNFAPPLQSAPYMVRLDASGEAANRPRYWPCDLLAAFTLQMSARACCVNSSMMLGSREYAIEKLTLAHTLGDDSLRELAVRMFEYFDDEPCHAVANLVGGVTTH